MPRLTAVALVLAALVAAPRVAAAETVFAAYDTIDAYDVRPNGGIRITGILAGASAPTTTLYNVGSSSTTTDNSMRCDRLALLAMTKPGKFQFFLIEDGFGPLSCRLKLRTP